MKDFLCSLLLAVLITSGIAACLCTLGCEEEKKTHESVPFDIHNKSVVIEGTTWNTFGEPYRMDSMIQLVADNGVIREFPVDAVRVLWEKQQKAEKQ